MFEFSDTNIIWIPCQLKVADGHLTAVQLRMGYLERMSVFEL